MSTHLLYTEPTLHALHKILLVGGDVQILNYGVHRWDG